MDCEKCDTTYDVNGMHAYSGDRVLLYLYVEYNLQEANELKVDC